MYAYISALRALPDRRDRLLDFLRRYRVSLRGLYLAGKHKNHWLCSILATFMAAVSTTYFVFAPECLGILWSSMGVEMSVYYPIAVVVGLAAAAGLMLLFMVKVKKFVGCPALED